MPNPWQFEIYRFILFLLISILLGWYFSDFGAMLFFGLIAYLGRHLIQVYRLERWLRQGAGDLPPHSNGIWREIYYDLRRLRRRGQQRKKKLGKILNRFRKATAALPDGTVVLGSNGEIDWFNNAAKQLLGLRKIDIGQHIGNLVRHPKFTNYLASKEYEKQIAIPAPRNPDTVIGIRIIPYGGGLRLLLAQDITRVKQMETMRRDFAANVSHELRTPLTVLTGYLETLQDFPDMSKKQYTQSIGNMIEQGERMQALIDDLIFLTRLETDLPEVVKDYIDIEKLVASLSKEFTGLNPGSTKLKFDLNTSAILLGNETEIRSAVSNLVSNALKYSSPGSVVMIRWIDDGAGARLDVVDNGDGITEEHIPRLTERFYRVDNNRSREEGGTGLGLAIVKHILKRHNSELIISSEPGKGSCFSCCFPAERVLRHRDSNVIKL